VDEHDARVGVDVTAAEFAALFEAVTSWGRWGVDDERGALNLLTPDRVAAAARLLSSRVVVSLSLPLNTSNALDCPTPAEFPLAIL
jgi:hypothetical protein